MTLILKLFITAETKMFLYHVLMVATFLRKAQYSVWREIIGLYREYKYIFLMPWKTNYMKSWLLIVWTVLAILVILAQRLKGWWLCISSYKNWRMPQLLLRSIETWQENSTSVLSFPFSCYLFSLELQTSVLMRVNKVF